MGRSLFLGWLRVARVAAVIAGIGCSRYVELGTVSPVPGGDARLTLSMRSSETGYGPIGSAVRQIEGKIISLSDSTIDMAVTGVTRVTGFSESWSGQKVSVARSNITSIEAKKLSMPRTLGTLGAFVAAGFVAHGAMGGEGTSTGVGKPNPGNKPGAAHQPLRIVHTSLTVLLPLPAVTAGILHPSATPRSDARRSCAIARLRRLHQTQGGDLCDD